MSVLSLTFLILLITRWVGSSDGYHFAIVNGGSPFFLPIEEGWNDECEQLGPDVTCEHWWDNITHHEEVTGIDYNKTRDKRTCVAYIRYILERGGVDGIATKCNVGEDDPPIIQEATDAGIPVVVFAGPHVGPYVSYIGTDNYETGRAMGQLLKQLRPEGGTYVTAYNGPSSKERAQGFEDEMQKDNEREDRAHWIEEPRLDLEAMGWNGSEFRGGVGHEKLNIILDAEPTAICMAYSTPFRNVNYTMNVDNHRSKNISFIGLEGASLELEYMQKGYIDGLVGQQTYQTGRQAARALYQIVTKGRDNVSRKFGTKLINYNLVPDDLPELIVDQHLLENLRYAGLVCFAVVVFCVLVCTIWTIYNRDGMVVKASQPFFLVMTATGVLIMAGTFIPLSIDDGGQDIPESKAVGICMSIPWLAFSGFTVVFSALFAKTWRVNQFFRSQSSHARIRVSRGDVTGPFFVIFGLNTIVLVCWTVLDPLTYVRKFSAGTDLFNRDLASTGSCRSENAVAFLVPLGMINLALLGIACWQAVEARNIQCEFAEAKWIGLTVFSMLQGFLTGIPIVAIVKDIPEAFYLILTFLLFAICMAVLLLIFLPKMMMQREYAGMTPAEQRKAMAVSVQRSSGRKGSSVGRISGLSSHFRTSLRTSYTNNSNNAGNTRPIIAEDGEPQEQGDDKGKLDPSKKFTDTTSNTERGISSAAETERGISSAFDAVDDVAGEETDEVGDSGAFVRRLDNSDGPALYSSYIEGEQIDA